MQSRPCRPGILAGSLIRCRIGILWLLVTALCSTSGAVAAAEPVRIGLIAPLSGGSSDFGRSVLNGARMAVQEINEVGGYLGRPLTLVERDDRGEPAAGRAAAEDLVRREAVAFTIGYCNTGVAMQALEVFESARHLLMVPCSQGSAVTRKTPARDSHVFRLAPADHMNAAVLVREIADRRRLRRVAILADTTGYGDGGVRDLSAELARRGLAPVAVLRFPLGVSSLRTELEQLRSQNVEAVVSYTVGPEQAVAALGRAEMGWRVPFFGPWTLSFGSVLRRAGPAALEGLVMTQSIIQDVAHERRSAFLARYLRVSGESPVGSLMAAAQSYDAVHLVLRALFQSRASTGPALKAALEDLREPYRGVVTTYDKPFSAQDHESFSEGMIWLGVWRSGRIQYLYPEDARLSGLIRRKHDRP